MLVSCATREPPPVFDALIRMILSLSTLSLSLSPSLPPPRPPVHPHTLGAPRASCLADGFGSSTRADVKKVFVSQEHQKTDMYGIGSPGPFARYEFAPSVGGTQPESKTQTMPSWKFGGARAPDTKGKASPGPAAYTLPQSVGPQPDSRKSRAGTPSFGSGSRDKRALVYLGPSHDKGMYGRGSPGPHATYQTVSSVGKQVASKMGSAPQAAFSQEDRWARYNKELKSNTTPGPGAY